MSEISRYEKIHWKVFNFLAKVTGWAFLFGGLVVGSYFLFSAFITGNTIDVKGVPSSDIINRAAAVILPYVIALFGFLLVRAKPYYPK